MVHESTASAKHKKIKPAPTGHYGSHRPHPSGVEFKAATVIMPCFLTRGRDLPAARPASQTIQKGSSDSLNGVPLGRSGIPA